MRKECKIEMWRTDFSKIEKLMLELVFDMYTHDEPRMGKELKLLTDRLTRFRKSRLYGGQN
jgi:hypothetical protein